MPDYLVTWRIDIEADTAEQAALATVALPRKPGSTAVVFEVRCGLFPRHRIGLFSS